MRLDRIILKIINNIFNEFQMHRQRVIRHGKTTINGRIKICSEGVCEFGDGIKINSGSNYNIIGGATRTNFIVQPGARLIIGDRTGISNSTIVVKQSVIIGKDVKIGGNCVIYDNDFHSVEYKYRILDDDPDIKTKPVEIEDGAFIGAHSIILKGVTIGEKAVIGAGSVVTHSVPAGEVWGGNPAERLK